MSVKIVNINPRHWQLRTFFSAAAFFNFHLCLFYLYQWWFWVTFKLLFCVFFIFLPLHPRVSSLGGQYTVASKQNERERNPIQHYLFIYNFVSIVLMEIFVSMSNSIKHLLLPLLPLHFTPSSQSPKSWIEINVFFM